MGIPKGEQIRFNADFWRSAVNCDALRDDQWERLEAFVPGGRDLPRQLGRHEAVKRRYYRWIEMGVLDEILAALAREADLEWLMIDSTIVRAHQHAAGARRQKGGRMLRALVAPAEA